MKHLFIPSFFIISITGVFAQTGTVKGKVSSNGKAIGFATVGVVGTSTGAISTIEGDYILKGIPAGSCVLQFTAVGFQKMKQKTTVLADQETIVNVNLPESSVKMDEVVISGTLKETFISDSPVHIEILTPKLFQKNPTPSLFEALQMVNGVRPQLNCNVCNTGDIHINGMEGPYTMILIDGMPIVSSLSTVYGLSGIPNSIVERIEIVKGPASTLYGSEAVGGLINVITKNPSKAPRLTVDLFATNQQEYNTDISLKSRLGKATTIISGNIFNFQNRLDINNDNFTDVTLQKRISVFNKWNFQRTDNRIATLAARYVNEDRFGGEMQWTDKWRGTDSIYGESIYTKRYEVIGAYQLPVSKEKLIFNYSYNNHNQNSYYGVVPYMARQDIAFGQLTWDKKLSEHQDAILGFAYRYTYYDDNTVATQSNDSLSPQNAAQNTYLPGIFLQDEITFNAANKLLLGIRYDYHSEHGNVFSPRLNYKWTPNKNNTIRFSLGNGYRVVNLFTEDHAALTGSRKVVVKNELNPERSYNININYNKFIDIKKGFIMLDASGFYTHFSNKIVGDFLTNSDQIIFDNLQGHAVSKGVTLNAEVSFDRPLKIIAGATLMDVYQVEKDSTGNEIKIPQLQAPSFSGTFTVSYKFNKMNLTVDYTGTVTGPMYLPVLANDFRPDQSPWFSIQNVQLTKKFKYGIELYGGVKNILDFVPKDPILRAFDPFDKNITVNNPNGYTFDPTYNYAPIQGMRGFLGVRFILQ